VEPIKAWDAATGTAKALQSSGLEWGEACMIVGVGVVLLGVLSYFVVKALGRKMREANAPLEKTLDGALTEQKETNRRLRALETTVAGLTATIDALRELIADLRRRQDEQEARIGRIALSWETGRGALDLQIRKTKQLLDEYMATRARHDDLYARMTGVDKG